MGDELQNQNPIPHVLLHEQEIATQRIIQAQSQREAAAGAAFKDGTDVLSERPNPSALKEHLMKMASEHRAEMASKRGKPTPPEQGNVEIGNGYGVPGGGAYYATPALNIAASGNLRLVNSDASQKNSELHGESKEKAASKDLPEYLKEKLRARGILKDGAITDDLSRTDNASFFFFLLSLVFIIVVC
ncbi:hypothetical protein COLO4_33517 [Corchorus olitorius]|uniref:Uncharacterized protein n=1 Tax=Corchorus olitorius TaxID=93759 RepID=A0A1R3GSY1_9ROSI|nr:hypothetical protein COLO4_33517 [Corchorus olitorius]